MSRFLIKSNYLQWSARHETLRVDAWGPDCVRVRCTLENEVGDASPILLEAASSKPSIKMDGNEAILVNGAITVRITDTGWIRFFKGNESEPFLQEEPCAKVRHFRSLIGGSYTAETRFTAHEDERFYGLGQHTHGFFDQKGCVIDLEQSNTNVTIPFLVSNRRYGFLWNNPAQGRVELGRTVTRWTAERTCQIDYLVMTGDNYHDIMARYADVTGHPPMLPEFASGFWQCKLRYKTQDELLNVAREYKRRQLPISVIVIDYFHWPYMGAWDFDPECFPDPEAMVKELKEMGIELMVSIWPTVNPDSPEWEEMYERGALVRTERGEMVQRCFTDTHVEGKAYLQYYDATHPAGREYLWQKVKKNYVDRGIRVFWLDSNEPEWFPHFDHDHLRYHAGNGEQVGNLYPYYHSKCFYDGLKKEGEDEVFLLCRGAWAGSQRFGSSVWSGDIPSTFEMMRIQIAAGLNTAMSGIPGWNSDIGGFHGGNIEDPEFRELVIRWFQWACFCPIMRLHGVRQPSTVKGGADNEVWSFGEEAYQILVEYLNLREKLRPYIAEQMQLAHKKGIPPMRPLFFDFPDDEEVYNIGDTYMFGSDLLVAPVTQMGQRSRLVYLPAGNNWKNVWSGVSYKGGQWLEVDAPLEQIPIFIRGNINYDKVFPGLEVIKKIG